MSAYLFSMLPDNAVLDWNAEADLLRFDNPAISAAGLRIGSSADGRNAVIEDAAGKTVTLQGVALFQLDASHLTFADGSRLVLPTIDNSFSFNLTGGSGNDLLLGAAPARDLSGAATNSAGTAPTNGAFYASLSGDGRLVAFNSSANDLVASDANNTADIFVKDLATGQTTRVSTSSAGTETNGQSVDPTISMNGRFVVFSSSATNLVAGDSNGVLDIFVKDLLTGATTRVSTDSTGAQTDQQSVDASIAGNGRFVAFTSNATNLVAGDVNGFSDIFLKDLQTGSTTLVSGFGTADSESTDAAISADGRVVAFDSFATNLVGGDTNAASDVFVRNVAGGGLQRVSTDASGVQANGGSSNASLSADGRYVAFESSASNLVAGDANGTGDVFVKDRVSGAVTLVSQRADGTQGNSFSGNATISGDGRYVAFYSNANNLADGDTNGWYDVFVKDLQTGALQRLSLGPDGNQGIATVMTFSWHPVFSADGSTITFTSPSRVLLPGDPTNGVTVYTVSNPLLGVTLAGGAGNDVYEIHRASDVVVEAAGAGVDSVRSSVSLTLAENVENLELIGTASIDATGNAGANILFGNDGDNVLDGLGGSDTASYVRASAGVTVDLDTADPQDTAGAGVDTLLNIENLTGSAFDDALLGNVGANILDGSAGADLMIGGAGNDTYSVDQAGDQIMEAAAGGTDTVRSSISYGLGADLENLTLLGSANLNGTGNSLNNVLAGNRGNNVLDGGLGTDTASYANALAGVTVGLDRTGPQSTVGAGVDTLISIENLQGSNFADTLHGDAGPNVLNGGAGVDTLSYARAGAAITVSLLPTTAQATGGAGLDTVLQFENLTGSNFNDSLTGSAGNNVLIGGLGNDLLDGGAGIDTVSYASAGSAVNVSLTTGLATGGAGSDTLANIENLTGSNFNDALTGNALNNLLVGGLGNDILNGGAGVDTASYAGASSAVTINLVAGTATGGGGADALSNIESLIGTSFADILIGNGLNNVLEGGLGNDTIDGATGTDTASYASASAGVIVTLATPGVQQNTVGAGLDTLTNIEALSGSIFNDILTGDAAANTLIGGSGDDVLIGADGDDVLAGAPGADIVTGGLGIDMFQFSSLVGADTVTDFFSGTDKFRFSQVGIRIGDGDTLVEGAVSVAGPGGFAPTSEVVIVTGDIAGAINSTSAAAAIGSANAAYALGATALFAVDDGSSTGLFLFTSAGTDAVISAAELIQIAAVTTSASTAIADYVFVA